VSGGGRPGWVLLLQRGEEDVLYEASAMTAAAVSLGLDVTLVWFDSALRRLAAGDLDAAGDGDREPGTAGAAARLLAEARETGHVRSLACSASLVAAAATGRVEEVRRRVDDVVGWPTTISLIRAAERSFVW
jgi:hypothetical protein